MLEVKAAEGAQKGEALVVIEEQVGRAARLRLDGERRRAQQQRPRVPREQQVEERPPRRLVKKVLLSGVVLGDAGEGLRTEKN